MMFSVYGAIFYCPPYWRGGSSRVITLRGAVVRLLALHVLIGIVFIIDSRSCIAFVIVITELRLREKGH